MPDHSPVLSAVVVIPDRYETVASTLRALSAQTICSQIEIVFVAGAGDMTLPPGALAGFHSFQKITAPIDSIGRAYAAGIRHARAPLVALTEDHSFPEPRWAERLVAAHRADHAVVAPAMRCGNPNSPVSWADFFIAYGKWAQPVSSQTMDFLPGHNSVYRRSALAPFWDALEEWFEAETVLHWELRRRGHTLWLEGSTFTAHLNFARWRPFLRAHWRGGRTFAARRAASWSLPKRFSFGLLSPLIPAVRFTRVLRDVRRIRLEWRFRLRVYAAVFAGLVADGLGQGLGYFIATGAPGSMLDQEFHRARYALPRNAAPHDVTSHDAMSHDATLVNDTSKFNA